MSRCGELPATHLETMCPCSVCIRLKRISSTSANKCTSHSSTEHPTMRAPQAASSSFARCTSWRRMQLLLLAATCLIVCGAQPTLQQDNPKSSPAITPTVIVRGFLNYRTTVDGTVLLFTPDAGGSVAPRQAATPVQVRPIGAGSSQVVINPPRDDQTLMVAAAATPVVGQVVVPTRRDSEPAVGADLGDGEHWRPVAATPPLRPTFELPPAEQVAPTQKPRALGGAGLPEPDVQPTVALQPNKQAPLVKFRAPTQIGVRPINGPTFKARNPVNPTGLQVAALRRPSLLGPAPEPTPESSTPSPFQARLNQASAKLRNRFKKPPVATTGKPAAPAPAPVVEDAQLVAASTENSPVDAPVSSSSSSTPPGSSSPTVGSDEVLGEAGGRSEKPEPRFGDQATEANSSAAAGLQQGQLGLMSANMDSFFTGDEIPFGGAQSAEASEHSSSHSDSAAPAAAPAAGAAGSGRRHSNNDRLNGWLDQHHNRFVQRPPKAEHSAAPNKHLAAQLDGSFSVNMNGPPHQPLRTTPSLNHSPNVTAGGSHNGSAGEPPIVTHSVSMEIDNSTAPGVFQAAPTTGAGMRTLTRVFSTVMTSLSSRIVPMQVQSSATAVTITEQYVITKLLTAYQTLPAQGEFLVPADELSTRGPMAMLGAGSGEPPAAGGLQEQPISAGNGATNELLQSAPIGQEQPISLEASSNRKSAADWLQELNGGGGGGFEQPALMQQLLAQQQALDATGPNQALSSEPLDQLASSLNPSLLAAANIPDLNNPLVLAAAIQNPQLAAVILAAQQIQLKQRAAKQQQQQQQQAALLASLAGADQAAAGNQMAPQQQQLLVQPSFSTNLVTAIKPSVYTVRDTMYTTRLVSFRDGRLVRTRTVSEPGQVIEQVLTTSVTEVSPVTVTLRPTGVLAGAQQLATAAPGLNSAQLSNALLATQLAQLLARRQQQVQPSFQQHLLSAAANNKQSSSSSSQVGRHQFQPSLQQLFASLQQDQQAASQQAAPMPQQAAPMQRGSPPAAPPPQAASSSAQATPPLPLVTTITNLQVRTYTVHNAFKVTYRTITSTQLLTSTLLG